MTHKKKSNSQQQFVDLPPAPKKPKSAYLFVCDKNIPKVMDTVTNNKNKTSFVYISNN